MIFGDCKVQMNNGAKCHHWLHPPWQATMSLHLHRGKQWLPVTMSHAANYTVWYYFNVNHVCIAYYATCGPLSNTVLQRYRIWDHGVLRSQRITNQRTCTNLDLDHIISRCWKLRKHQSSFFTHQAAASLPLPPSTSGSNIWAAPFPSQLWNCRGSGSVSFSSAADWRPVESICSKVATWNDSKKRFTD